MNRACAACAGVVLLGGMLAGERARAGVAERQPLAAAERSGAILVEDHVARLARRTALLDLRLQPSPDRGDYAATAALLELVAERVAGDVLLRREIINAYTAAGDGDAALRHTRDLVRLDPRDTVAQVRLISAQIASRQTVEERIALYERFLGERGRRLDASVRSRLALDAALLRRELGDRSGFFDGLAQAIELDATNKDAAELAAEVFAADAESDPMAMLELESNLLYADPLDPAVHRTIAGLLIVEGAIEQASRFHETAILLADLTGTLGEEIDSERAILTWLNDDPAEVSRGLESLLRTFRAQAQAQIDGAIAADLPTDELRQPDEVRLSPSLEMIRLLLANQAGNEERVKASLADFTATLTFTVTELTDQINAGSVEALQAAYFAFQTLQLSRALTGQELEQMGIDLRDQIERNPAFAPLLAHFQPWIAYHAGEYEEALQLASRLLGDYNEVSALAGAAALEKLGRDADAITAYRAIARRSALTTVGAYAFQRIRELGGETASEVGQQMGAFAARIPAWVDRMARQPRTFMSIELEASATGHNPGDPPVLSLRVRNVAPVALSFGPGATISSRFLLLGLVDRQAPGFEGDPQPGVLELDARLRLESREELVVQFPADTGYTGWLTDSQPGISIRRRWRALQGFEVGRRGVFIPGGTSLADETLSVVRRPSRFASLETGALIEALRAGEAPNEVLPVLRSRLMGIDRGASPAEARDAAEALQAMYTEADTAGRLAMLVDLPWASQAQAMELFDAGVLVSLEDETDPLVLATALLTRASDPGDPALVAALQHEDARVRAVAASLDRRLRDDAPTLATSGPGLQALAM